MDRKDKKRTARARRIRNSGEYVDVSFTIKQMEKMIDEKLQSMKFFIPFVLTIVTSLLAYLFTTTSNAFDDYIYIIVAYLLLCLGSILRAYKPSNRYIGKESWFKFEKKLKRNLEFYPDIQPWNMESYINLSDTEFITRLEKFVSRKLYQDELMSAQFLKQKINEYRYKKRNISISYTVIIVGALALALLFAIEYVWSVM
ncbi:MAG: hypothetical protein J6S23_05465 [Clostridia bacterium]|nr:hypothetical protein [Clostridia bacterium]